MADVQPLRALHYDLARVGPLAGVIAPPYDVIDGDQRTALAARSPWNVVDIDLPQGDDPYAAAAARLADWQADGAVVRDPGPAMWALAQDYTGPDGARRTRTGLFARVRVEDYGPGRIRPHERTHPGPKEDRLRLTRATRANLSPIFSLYGDPTGAARAVLDGVTTGAPWAEAVDDDGTANRLWRIGDPGTVAALQEALAGAELLIADGHHRYETARAYAEEIGGEGDHRYVLMLLVALEDPGLTVFPTHRLLTGLAGDPARQEALAAALRAHFAIEELADRAGLAPAEGPAVRMGYIDSHLRRPFLLTLADEAAVAAALPGASEAYRHLDTAVLEALVLTGALGMTEDDISHFRGLGYARSFDEALARVDDGSCDAAFFMAPTPVARIAAVAEAGETMPPKSTYFYPKVPTGLLFSPLA